MSKNIKFRPLWNTITVSVENGCTDIYILYYIILYYILYYIILYIYYEIDTLFMDLEIQDVNLSSTFCTLNVFIYCTRLDYGELDALIACNDYGGKCSYTIGSIIRLCPEIAVRTSGDLSD